MLGSKEIFLHLQNDKTGDAKQLPQNISHKYKHFPVNSKKQQQQLMIESYLE